MIQFEIFWFFQFCFQLMLIFWPSDGALFLCLKICQIRVGGKLGHYGFQDNRLLFLVDTEGTIFLKIGIFWSHWNIGSDIMSYTRIQVRFHYIQTNVLMLVFSFKQIVAGYHPYGPYGWYPGAVSFQNISRWQSFVNEKNDGLSFFDCIVFKYWKIGIK